MLVWHPDLEPTAGSVPKARDGSLDGILESVHSRGNRKLLLSQ